MNLGIPRHAGLAAAHLPRLFGVSGLAGFGPLAAAAACAARAAFAALHLMLVLGHGFAGPGAATDALGLNTDVQVSVNLRGKGTRMDLLSSCRVTQY